jgi:hypothetical protein
MKKFDEWSIDDQKNLIQKLEEIIEAEYAQIKRKKNLVRFIKRTANSYKY